jgi:photosystem II stability/assembly factor-like uncharacterized protein
MSDVFHVASRKGLFTFRKKGKGKSAKWEAGTPAFLGEPVVAVLTDPRDETIHAALRMGHFGPKMRRSADGGKSWEDVPTPRFAVEPEPMPMPSTVEGFADYMAYQEERKKGPSVDTIWIMAAGGADQPGLVWAGTMPGGLFKSTDGGDSWSLVESLWNVPQREKWTGGGADLPGIHSVYVDPRDSKKLTLGVSCGGVWKSDDAGASWRQAGHGLRAAFLPPEMAYDPTGQDAHRLAHCAANPDTVWCQHHNGVFLSRNGGDKFEEITDINPSVFGFAVASHPKDENTAWLVPGIKDEQRVPVDGKFVVTRTQDGGETWESLSEGLPAGPAWDLVYRHGLDIDTSGKKLVMGSTTGNLWVTEDGGESWAHVSAHLPPIAAVTWG